MKKLLALMVAGILVLSGCSESDQKEVEKKAEETAEETKEVAKEAKGTVEEETQEEPAEEAPIVKIEDLPYEYTILKPDSIGEVYVSFTYENKSEYPITGFDLTIKKADDEEITYASTYDTVMPGKKAAKFEASGPKSRKKEDLEFQKLSYIVKDKENKIEHHITYDYQLKEYEVLEVEPD